MAKSGRLAGLAALGALAYKLRADDKKSVPAASSAYVPAAPAAAAPAPAEADQGGPLSPGEALSKDGYYGRKPVMGGPLSPGEALSDEGLKKGGKVKMSSASKRADGIASKGKTRGKIY